MHIKVVEVSASPEIIRISMRINSPLCGSTSYHPHSAYYSGPPVRLLGSIQLSHTIYMKSCSQLPLVHKYTQAKCMPTTHQEMINDQERHEVKQRITKESQTLTTTERFLKKKSSKMSSHKSLDKPTSPPNQKIKYIACRTTHRTYRTAWLSLGEDHDLNFNVDNCCFGAPDEMTDSVVLLGTIAQNQHNC